MRHYSTIIGAIVVAVALCASAGSAETVHPTGAGVAAYYQLSGTTISTEDTLVVSRGIVNDESFSLAGLYLSEQLPPELQLVSAVVTINGAPTAIADSTLPSGTVLSGYTAHCWMLGSPSGGATLDPGDSLSLVVKLTCTTEGSYALPLHAATWFGNGDGYFAADNGAAITVTTPIDTIPPAAIFDLSASSGN